MVIQTISDLTKNTIASKEIIKQNKVKKIIAIYDKFSTVKGVAVSGLKFLLNLAMIKEGRKSLQENGIGVKLVAKLLQTN